MRPLRDLSSEPEYRFRALGLWTLAAATVLIAVGIWQSNYALALAAVLAEVLIILWAQRSTDASTAVHGLFVFALVCGVLYLLFFKAPELFFLLDTYLHAR